MPPSGYGALSSLVHQGTVPVTTAALVYSPANPVELTRVSLTNYKASGDAAVTLYHRVVGATGAPADSETVAVYTVSAGTTAVDPVDNAGPITLQGGDALWAVAGAASTVAVAVYALPQNMAPISTPYGIF